MKRVSRPRLRGDGVRVWIGVLGLCGWLGCGAEHVVGSIGLGTVVHYPLASIAAIAVADFDGDGHPDVVSQDRDGQTVCLLRGVGDGSLLSPRCQKLSDPATVIAALPSTASGAMLLRARSEVARLALGSDGLFAQIDKSSLTPMGTAQGLTVADVDGDGRTDVLVTETSAVGVEVLRSTASGLRSAGRYVVPVAPKELLYQDVDGDHHPELAMLVPDGLKLWGERGLARWSGCTSEGPQFVRPVGLWLVQRWLRGLPALLVFEASQGFLRVIRATASGDFSFVCGEVATLPSTPAEVIAGTTTDLDGDGMTELLLAGSDGSLRAYRTGDGEISMLTEQTLGTAVSSMTIADLDHDDLPEVILVSAARDEILVIPNLFRR